MAAKPFPAFLPPLSANVLQGEVVVALDCEALLGDAGPFPVPGLHHVVLSNLDADFLARLGPRMIILPLFAAGYDAISAVERLERLGYTGKIAVLAPHLPKPALVEAELRGLGPGDRLTLITP